MSKRKIFHGWMVLFWGIALLLCREAAGQVITAHFTDTPTNGNAPLVVQFYGPITNSLQNPVTGWSWNFGDGFGTSTNQNPVYMYTNSGYYVANCTTTYASGPSVVATGPGINVNPAPSIIWTNIAGGNWNTAANWSPNQVPGPTDAVYITNGGTYAVTLNVSTSVASLTVGGAGTGIQTLQETGFTLSATNAAIDNGGILSLSNSTFVGAIDVYNAGTFTIDNMYVDAQVTVEGGGQMLAVGTDSDLGQPDDTSDPGYWLLVQNGGVFDSTAGLHLYSIMTNGGVMNLTGTSLEIYNNGTTAYDGGFYNLAGGVVNFGGGAGITGNLGDDYAINQGVINVTNGTSVIGVGLGALSGVFSASPGTIVEFDSDSTAGTVLNSGLSLGGTGQYQYVGGLITATNNTPANLQYTGGTLALGAQFEGGSITNLALDGIILTNTLPVTGTLAVTNGTVQGSFLVSTGGVFIVDNIYLDAQVTVEGGGQMLAVGTDSDLGQPDDTSDPGYWLLVQNGGVFDSTAGLHLYSIMTNGGVMNLSGTSLEIYNNGTTAYDGGFYNLAGGVVNFGGGAGITGNLGDDYAINQGVINVTNGTSVIGVGLGALSGVFSASPGTIVEFDSDSTAGTVLNSGLSLGGTGQYQYVGGLITATNNTPANLQYTGGTLALGAQFEGGSITNLALDGIILTNTLPVTGTLAVTNGTVQGSFLVSTGGVFIVDNIYLDAQVTVEGGGQMLAVGTDSDLGQPDDTSDPGYWLLVQNGGVFDSTAGLHLYSIMTNGGVMNLTGTSLEIYNNGTTAYDGGFYNLAGGVVNFGGGAGITGNLGDDYAINQGVINVTNGTSVIGVGLGALSGVFSASPGTIVEFDSDSTAGTVLNSGLSLGGTGQYQYVGGLITATNNTPANLQYTGGTLALGAQFEGGSITNLALDGIILTNTLPVTGTLAVTNGTVQGSFLVSTGGVFIVDNIYLDAQVTVEGGGQMLAVGTDSDLGQPDDTSDPGYWLLVQNGGVFDSTAGLHLYSIMTNGGVMNLTGTSLEIYNNGTTAYDGGFYNLAGGVVNFGGGAGITGNLGDDYAINQGVINVTNGTSVIGVGLGALSGVFSASPGTIVEFDSDSTAGTVLNSGLSLGGTGQYQYVGGLITATNNTPANLQYTGGTLALGAQFEGGSITNLALDGIILTNTLPVTGTLAVTNGTVQGSFLVSTGGVFIVDNIYLDAQVTVEGGGQMLAVGTDSDLGQPDDTSDPGYWLLVQNGGVFDSTAGLHLYSIMTNGGVMNLSGTSLEIYNNGTTAYDGGFYNLAGGVVNFGGGAGITGNLGDDYAINQGVISFTNGSITSYIDVDQFTNAAILNVQHGTLELEGTHVALQPSETLSISLNSAADYGSINYNNTNILNLAQAGNLLVTLAGGYAPATNTVFQVLTYPSTTSGTFSSVDLPSSISWQTTYGATTLALKALGVPAPPTAQFTVSPTNSPVYLPVQFTGPSVDSSNNTITSWNWNFGDGGTSAVQNPTHTYTTIGTFSPSLTVSNSQGMSIAATGPAVTIISDVLEGPLVNPANGHRYIIVQPGTWSNAQAEAQGLGANLVTIRNATENGWIVSNLLVDFSGSGGPNLSRTPIWIGLFDPTQGDGNGAQHAADFVWADGETNSYRNWQPGEPNNTGGFEYYGTINWHWAAGDAGSQGTWNDAGLDGTSFAGTTSGTGIGPYYGIAEIIPGSLTGTQVTGSLLFLDQGSNAFDPATGSVPAGYANSSSPTFTIGPGSNVFYSGQPGSYNFDSADFDGNTLTVQDVMVSNGADAWTMTFTDPAFTGITPISDNFINGGIVPSIEGDVITLNWAGSYGPDEYVLVGTYTAVFSLNSTNAPLTVTSVTPASGGNVASVNTPITATFSEGINAGTLTASSFTVVGPGSTVVPGSFSYNATSFTAIFTPASPLTLGASYTATITTNVLDLQGNTLATNYAWSFSTSDLLEPNIGPVILADNDDSSTPEIALPFPVHIYGNDYSNFWINNNGDATFTGPLSTYTAFAFPNNEHIVIIAPFFADVDTIGEDAGAVYYNTFPDHIAVTWDAVGYYDEHTDKLDTFQLVIYAPTTNGNLFGFSYGEMQWTTGDASGGSDGFGGDPAVAGFDSGDGTQAVKFFSGNTPASLTNLAYQTFFYLSSGTPTASSFPTVAFTASPTNGGPPLSVQFNSPAFDSLGEAITNWIWNFGDGTVSTNQNPLHTYSSLGTYMPSLTVDNIIGTPIVATGPSIRVELVPTIHWPPPSPIIYGTPLSSTQLDATANTNLIPGNLAFTPPLGTVLGTGTQTLSVVFTPTNSELYSSVTNIVTLVVEPEPLTVAANNTNWLGGRTFPTFTGTISGVVNGDNITATYSSAANSNSPAGTYPIVPALNPSSQLTNYAVTLIDGTLAISRGVLVTSPVNGSSFGTNSTFIFSAAANLAAGEQSLALYTNGVQVATANSSTVSTVLGNLASGSYVLTAVATPPSGPAVTSPSVYITVNAPGTTLVDFDALDTRKGVMIDGALSSYLAGFGITAGGVTFGTSLEAATGAEAVNQNNNAGAELPVPSSAPNLFTQAGSFQPVSFTLSFASPLTSFGFTRVGLQTNGAGLISHPAWTATALDASNNVLGSVSEPLLLSSSNIAPRSFGLTNLNIAGVRFDSDSQGGTAAFGAVLLDDLVLGTNSINEVNLLGVTLVQPAQATSPATIPLTAQVTDPFGTNFVVSFYSGPTLIGTGVNSGTNSAFTWSNVLNGTYSLTAEVTDASGYAVFSPPAPVVVAPGANATVTKVDFDDASALSNLAGYLGSFEIGVISNSADTEVEAVNQDALAGGGFVIASSPSNVLTQIGSNGPVSFTVGFTNLLGQFSFTRPELVANPFVTHPAWQVEAFDPLGQLLAATNWPQISSATNVPAQTYTLTNSGAGIASISFNSEGSGFTTVNALVLDDFILTKGSNLPPAVALTSPTNGQALTNLSDITLSAQAAGSGSITGVGFYINGTGLAGSAQSAPYSTVWAAPASGTYILTAVATNGGGLTATSAPVAISVNTSFALVLPPTNQTVGVGNSAVFSVLTSPTNGVAYQWLSNGLAIPGATLSTYTATGAADSAPGSFSYSVIAMGQGVSLTNQPPAVLTVLGPPTINHISPGTNVELAIGTNVTLSVSASDTGVPFYYQWQRNGQFLAGATNSSYTISNAQPSDSGDYQVLVANAVASQESPVFAVTVSFPGSSQPVTTNDVFASSLAIDPTNGPVAGNNSGSPATGELAAIAGKPAGRFLWFNWTAQFTGAITLSTLGSSFDTLLGVYTGDSPSALVALAEDDDMGGYFTSQVSFDCTNGMTYQIAVAGFKGASNSVVLFSPSFIMLDTNYLSVAEPEITAEPASQIVQEGQTVTLSIEAFNATTYQWYFNSAPVNGGNEASLVISNFPAGAAGQYYAVAANEVGSVQSEPAAIELQNTNETVNGSTNLLVDKFGDAVDLTGGETAQRFHPHDAGGDTAGFTLSQSFSTLGATKEEGEPNHAGQPGGASYWYSYSALYPGSVRFDTSNSAFNTILAIYTGPGNSFSTLTNVGSGYTTNYQLQGQPSVVVSNTATTKYYIAIDGYLGASGPAHLNVFFTPSTNSAGTNIVLLTNSLIAIDIAAPGNNYLTTSSNLTVRGTVKASNLGRQSLLSYVQVAVNTNLYRAALGQATYSDVLAQAPGGLEEAVAVQTVGWSTNVTLVPGANLITAQGYETNGQTNVTLPVTRTVFYVAALPSARDKSTLTLQTSGQGRITGQPSGAQLEINKVYTVKAQPASDWIFTNWTGGTNATNLGVVSSNTAYSFIMATNLVLQANFIPNPFIGLAGTYNGLFAPTNGATETGSGFFTATLPPGSRGTYSAKILLDGGSYPFSGAFDLAGQAGQTINRPGQTPLIATLQLNLAATNDPMTGAIINPVTSNGFTSPLTAERATYNPHTNPDTNNAGHYTFIIPSGPNAPASAPTGHATLTDTLAGHVQINGRMPDNAAFSQSVAIGTNGNVPFYSFLYSRHGSIQGWLTLTNDPGPTLAGTNLTWVKDTAATNFIITNIPIQDVSP